MTLDAADPKPRIGQLRMSLLAETRAAHHAVEQTVFAKALMHGSLSLQLHADVLSAWRPVWEVLEAAAATYPMAGVWHPVSRLSRLATDLAWLDARGVRPGPDAEAQGNPLATLARQLSGTVELLGLVYVLEGSALGGQVLSRRLMALGVPESAATFHRPHGDQARPRVAEFFGRLEAAVRPSEIDGVVGAAVRTFSAVRTLHESAVVPAAELS